MAHALTSDALSATRWADDGEPPRFHLDALGTDAWEVLLALAEAHGWEPAGTLAPVVYAAHGMELASPPWDGNYWTQDYQVVTAADATRLADALERAAREWWDAGRIQSGWAVVDAPGPLPGLTRRRLWDLIAFCRRGPFDIG